MAEVMSEKALEKANEIYETNERVKKSYKASTDLKAEAKGGWTRIQEVLSYIKLMGYENVGLAYCAGFKGEADTLAEIFSGNGVLQNLSHGCLQGYASKRLPDHSPRRGKRLPPCFFRVSR